MPENALDHPCLVGEGVSSEPLEELGDGAASDRHRVALLLQGAALLAHLHEARLHLPDGWAGAAVAADGLTLRAGPAAAGRSVRLPQEQLCDLLARLFGLGRRRRVAGRGAARRAARALHRRWGDGLYPLPHDLAVEQVLEEAPFLWEPPFADARRALAARHLRRGRWRPWVAGPGPFRWRLLRTGDGVERLRERLARDGALALWTGPSPDAGLSELVEAGRWRAALAAAACRPPAGAAGRRALASALFALGRAERALAVLEEENGAADHGLVAACQLQLGRLRAARRTAAAGRAATLPAEERLRLADVAVRALANAGDLDGARKEAEACLEEHRRGPARRAAHLLVAVAAWDRGDRETLELHLEASRDLVDDAHWGWRWSQTAALAALAAGDPRRAEEELAAALTGHRRRLPLTAAAGLWNDLGLTRARQGDLAGAEKAFARSLALYRRCDGPRHATVALANLAEVRMRRGRLGGAGAILERITAANRAAGNVRGAVHDLLLWGRNELAHGRATAALDLFGRAAERGAEHDLDEVGWEASLLRARALGWLGRAPEAAELLAGLEPLRAGHLESEELPALLALAGRRDDALAAAHGAGVGALWQAALAGRPVAPEAWGALDGLEDYRAARAVFDLDRAAADAVPAERRRAAIATLRRRGAVRLAERLEAREGGPWRALARHLAAEGDDGAARSLGRLLADAGYPGARLWWESEHDARVLVDGPGGDEELSAPCDGGRLVLRAPVMDAPLAALFQVARRGAPARLAALRSEGNGTRRRHSGPDRGIVGDSPELRRAVTRAERLAAGEMPLLVLGESGTGKELVARLVHRRSRRRDGPWVAVNCAALSETLVLSDLFGHVRGAFTGADRERAGVFETAAGGTVFLDEIGDLPASAQGMLLRVLQEGEVRRVGESLPRRVDVRVVAATHRDLGAMVRAGDFRRDLYYRLKGAVVELPPLRSRGRDVLLLADHLLAAGGNGAGGANGDATPPRLDRAARARLLAHDWPGNVRELENVLAVAAALAAADGAAAISADHLELPDPAAAAPAGRAPGYHQQVEAFRRRLLTEALGETGGNQSAAARRLGLSRQAMSYLVRELEISLQRRP